MQNAKLKMYPNVLAEGSSVLHSAPEEVVVLLVGDADLEVEAVRPHGVPALLPLHSLAPRLGLHLTGGLGPGPAGPPDGGHLLRVAAHLVVGDGLGGVTVIRLNLLGHNLVHQLAVLPFDILAVLIASPDLLPSLIRGPLGVALLLGDGGALGHLLGLGQDLDRAGLTILGDEGLQLQGVIGDCLGVGGLLALCEPDNPALSDRDVATHLGLPRLTVGVLLVAAHLGGGDVVVHIVVIRDVHTAVMVMSLPGVVLVVHVVVFEAQGGGQTDGEDDDLHHVCCCQLESDVFTGL